MECSRPPELSPDQLSEAIDGTAEAAIHDHLVHCASCTARLQSARLAEENLRRRLSRWDCPPPDQLGDYEQGLLAQPEAAAVAEHLRQCVLCSAELQDLRQFLDERPRAPVTAPRTPRRRAVGLGELIARLLPPSPALALRGEGRAPITAETDGATIVLDVQPAASGQIDILGQVAAEDQARWSGALVTLRQSGVLKATAVIDDLGGFQFTGMPPEQTEFRLTPPDGQPVLLPGVELSV